MVSLAERTADRSLSERRAEYVAEIERIVAHAGLTGIECGTPLPF